MTSLINAPEEWFSDVYKPETSMSDTKRNY